MDMRKRRNTQNLLRRAETLHTRVGKENTRRPVFAAYFSLELTELTEKYAHAALSTLKATTRISTNKRRIKNIFGFIMANKRKLAEDKTAQKKVKMSVFNGKCFQANTSSIFLNCLIKSPLSQRR